MPKKILLATAISFAIASSALAQDTLYVYGPGSPAPAMNEAAVAFEKTTGVKEEGSAEARQTWIDNKDIDVWLIWNIWQVANAQLADIVPVERDYAIYRDTGIAITKRAENKPSDQAFASFLESPAGAKIFARGGWETGRK